MSHFAGRAFSVYLLHRRDWPTFDTSKHIQLFRDYFDENCSLQDLRSLSHETTADGIMEVLSYLSEHLLSQYRF